MSRIKYKLEIEYESSGVGKEQDRKLIRASEEHFIMIRKMIGKTGIVNGGIVWTARGDCDSKLS